MKRFLYICLSVLILFILLLYWSLSTTDGTFERSTLLNIENVDTVNFHDHDSVLVSASSLYESNYIKKIMQGEQYRKAWAAPVKVPIVFLDTLFGGVTIMKEGGGNQTHSLKLKARNGIEYALRSVNKDPDPLIPQFAKTLGLENIVVDGISAQHPYGALLASKLSEAAQVLHTHAKVVFLPKQIKLKDYNEKFGNRLFLLEYETDGEINWTNLPNIEFLLDTEDLQELKAKYPNQVSVNKQALIRARLFDFLIGDWDRHTKQWGFAVQKIDSNYVAMPIPSDRDNAFFDSDGIIPSILANKHIIPEMRPFEDDIDFIEGLVYPFDRYFLMNTPENYFVSEAKALQTLLTDAEIDKALNIWPKNISELDGTEITTKIKSRRDDLVKYAKKFKAEIDKQGVLKANLKGSEDKNFGKNLTACFECN